MERFKKAFEDIMTASAFAEAGEFETAREMLRESRCVLLAVRSDLISRKTLLYALNACKRIGAGLDILYISDDGEEVDMLKEFMSNLQREGISFSLIKKRGCLKKEIIDYVNSRKNINFVVVESSDNLDVECTGGILSEAWRRLKCPLVVVMEQTNPV